MEQFIIEGGVPLKGTVKPGGNKNAILKMLPACLLTDEPVTLRNVPDILDVRVSIEIMQKLGCDIEWLSEDSLRVHAKNITSSMLDENLATRIRTSFVFAGPMLARMGRLSVPMPGGDVIGERRLDTHVHALRKLGAEVRFERGMFSIQASRLVGTSILLNEASVTATENALLAAVTASGTTVINNAASEPHVQNLCQMLIAMGAQIDGVGSNRLTIQGVEKLHGCEATVGADYMEVGSWIGAAVLTGGDLRITQADPQVLGMVELVFARLGVEWTVEGQDIVVPTSQRLTIEPDLGNRIPVIKAQPWPAFPADLMSIALVVATQSKGAVMFHDWMFESRLFFTDKLVQMGARIMLCDPHRVLVQGPTALRAVPLVTSPDIRAGMSILCAALAAPGTTRIANVRQIDRGYERVEQKLRSLGARIERVTVDDHQTQEVRAVMP
ncbi:MAG: UDP-N-acetylglucosamine 1-carboxyvinyltransferase [Anaerolineae bacterium]|nr:UDP-N-acetylglucosamine 1-carboxyvinyltransferase [Anaerolineae bacterium]